MMTRVFGLTGGVASGKSTVVARLRERGLAVIDADAVARDVVAPGSEGLARVAAAFGRDVLCADGSLARPKLGRLVFADAAARARLEAIVHPLVGAETARRVAALGEAGVELVCYDAALLVENGLADAFRPLVVVAASRDVQRRRLMARDGLDDAEADRRIAAQLPLADKRDAADYLIDNDGDFEALRARTDAVLDDIVARHARGEL